MYWLNEESVEFLRQGYIYEDETPEQRIRDIADQAQKILGIDGFADKFYDYMSRGFFSLSSPVWANFGRQRGCPISCFGSYCGDSISEILDTASEVGLMTKMGGGTSAYFGDVRCAGSPITGGGESEGVTPFLRIYESVVNVCKQSDVRRGSFAAYLPIDHGDIREFLKIRTRGNPIQHIFPAVTVPDYWMQEMIDGDPEKREIWAEVIKARTESGTPYVMFTDNCQKNRPECYSDQSIRSSNLCVAPEQLLLTSEGYLPIGSLENKEVTVWNGFEWSETKVVKTSDDSELLKIRFSDQTEINCTPWHKFYIVREYGATPIEVRAHELKSGDKIQKFVLPTDLEFNRELENAYSLGFYSGDGNEGYNFSSVYKEKEAVIPRLFGTVSDEFDNNGRKKWTHGYIKDKFFVPIGYSNKSKVDWLAGYFDADGCVVESNNCQNIQVCSVELDFIKRVRLMLQEMGVQSSLSLRRDAGSYLLPKNDGSEEDGLYNCQTLWLLNINGTGLKRLVSLGLKTERLAIDSNQSPNRSASKFVTVESVERTGRRDKTYCANEPIRHTLVFNGILTGNCSEIALPVQGDESFVCCLSSINLLHWEEIEQTDAIEVLTFFLDAVMTEFIQKSEGHRELERARKFAIRHRALGLGVLGWHSYLQSKMIAFEDMAAKYQTHRIFSKLRNDTYEASRKLAEMFGPCEIAASEGRRNTTLMAIAPTKSSSFILGQVSQSVEPEFSNYHVKNRAKIRYSHKNPYLEKLLIELGRNTDEVWESILLNDGSVQHLDFLSEHQKDVFKTFGEISQKEIVIQAAIRQKYIDQGQSLNLMIHPDTPVKDINKLMIFAWEQGIKTLYYQHSINAAQALFRDINSCKSCEG